MLNLLICGVVQGVEPSDHLHSAQIPPYAGRGAGTLTCEGIAMTRTQSDPTTVNKVKSIPVASYTEQ